MNPFLKLKFSEKSFPEMIFSRKFQNILGKKFENFFEDKLSENFLKLYFLPFFCFCKSFENCIPENESFENRSLAVRILLTFGQLQKAITQMFLTLRNHLIHFNDSTYQDL